MHLEIIILYFPYVVDRPGDIKTTCLHPEDVPESNLDLSRLTSYRVDELKFWLSCRGDSLKKLPTKAACIQRCVSVTVRYHFKHFVVLKNIFNLLGSTNM